MIRTLALLALTTPAAAASFTSYDDNLYQVAGLGFRAKEDCTVLPTPVRAWSNAHRYAAPAQVVCADVAWLGGKWGTDAPDAPEAVDDAEEPVASVAMAGVETFVVPAPVAVPAPQRGSYANLPPVPFDLSGPRRTIINIERFMDPPDPEPSPEPEVVPTPPPVPLPAGAFLLIGALALLASVRRSAQVGEPK